MKMANAELDNTSFGKRVAGILCRKKPIPVDYVSTQLKRCLNIIDLTFLSIGAVIGSGIFVLTGNSVRNVSGAGIIISFVVAGIPSAISALCYAEFGARVPKAGSTYDFIYVSMGEFWAALVGWHLIVSPIFTGATMAHAWSDYFDTMFDGWIANRTQETIGTFNSPYLSHYPDFFAACLILVVCAVVAAGAKCSTLFNNIFAGVKLLIIAFIICYGFSFADSRYWTDSQFGGFMPYGFKGVMSAAPTAYFAYSGFEQACIAGEEAKNPTRQIVWAIIMSLAISAVAYILMCSALTLMIPYDQVSLTASFADAFAQRGAYWAKYVVAIGALSGLTNVLFGSIFPVPRYIYAVASDGLMPRWIAALNSRTKVPIRAIVIYAVLAVLAILLFDLDKLVSFLSMGGLLCTTLVVASIIILRYSPRNDHDDVPRINNNYRSAVAAGDLKKRWAGTILGTIFGRFASGSAVVLLVVVQTVIMVACSLALVYAPWDYPRSIAFGASMAVVAVTGLILILIQFIISAFVQSEDEHLWFRVPLVPLLPSISMFMNILMIMLLEPWTWIRFGLYLVLGVINYALYGVRHSALRKTAAISPAELADGYVVTTQNTKI